MGKDAREYRKSSPVTSNTENTMFADAPEEKNGKQEVEISRFRQIYVTISKTRKPYLL